MLASQRMPETFKLECASTFGIYIHWPFCTSICPYCDFNVRRSRNVDAERWCNALLVAISNASRRFPNKLASSLYFGGGTPSLMSVATVAAIIEQVEKCFGFVKNAEISLEANPDSSHAKGFKGLRQVGINRLSMGVQAFNDDALKWLGRSHSVREAERSIDTARNLFPRMSFDLIYCRPGQSCHEWRAELRRSLQFCGGHISLYQLTIESGTAFARASARGDLVLPEQDSAAELYEISQEECGAIGLRCYEISNHALPGHESQHNLGYWRYNEYLGIGPGAHSRLIDKGKRCAEEQIQDPKAWLASVETSGHGVDRCEVLSADTQAAEMLMMGLRLRDGLSLDRFNWVTGKPLEKFVSYQGLSALKDKGLLMESRGSLFATERGLRVLDAVLEKLLL